MTHWLNFSNQSNVLNTHLTRLWMRKAWRLLSMLQAMWARSCPLKRNIHVVKATSHASWRGAGLEPQRTSISAGGERKYGYRRKRYTSMNAPCRIPLGWCGNFDTTVFRKCSGRHDKSYINSDAVQSIQSDWMQHKRTAMIDVTILLIFKTRGWQYS